MAGLIFDEYDAEELAQYLADNGVIVTPVRIGQEVYAALPSCFTDEESIVYAWDIKGLGIDNKGRYIAFNGYGEQFIVGEDGCRLTREEAEEDLRRFEETANAECGMQSEELEDEEDECEETSEGD